MESAQDFLHYLVGQIINSPDDVMVEATSDQDGILLTVHVPKEFMGTLIGRMGKTIEAVRTIMRTYSMHLGCRVSLKIAEPE